MLVSNEQDDVVAVPERYSVVGCDARPDKIIGGETGFRKTLAPIIIGLFVDMVLTALPQGAAAGYGSYIVGQAARYYFEHGASWGQQGPKRVVSRILEITDKQSVLQRIKEEIKKKLSVNRYAGK